MIVRFFWGAVAKHKFGRQLFQDPVVGYVRAKLYSSHPNDVR